MTDMPIDIHEPITELCSRLGLNPSDVAEIRVLPTAVSVVVYKWNEQGFAYLDGGGVARDTLAFRVKT